jgi:hypothetical protein
MMIALDHYQLQAGLSQSVLEDTRYLPHTDGFWYDSVRTFLHSVGATIEIESAWNVRPMRKVDKNLMEEFMDLDEFSNLELCQLNRCRLYLQVTTLAEITDHTG